MTKAIMPIMSKALAALAESITEQYNKTLDYLCAENEKLSNRLLEENNLHQEAIAEREQRIAELTEALAHAGKSATDSASKTEMPKRTKKYGKDAIKHCQFDKIAKCVKANRPVYLCGPAGSGKTQICEMVAESLNLDFYMTAKIDDAFGLVGYMDGHGKYNETAFYKAMKYGGLFMFDEFDASAPDAAVAINAANANKYFQFPNAEMVYAHKDFRVIACGNTFGTGADEHYTGRAPLDASSIDRFGYIFVDYDERVELACAKGNREVVQFVHDLRNAMKKSRISPFTISYRGITNLVEFEQMFGVNDAVQMAITKGLDDDNIAILYRNLSIHSNKYAMAFSKSATAYANAA